MFVADNAGQANQLATAARDQAEKGGAVVGNAVTAMKLPFGLTC